MKIDWFDYLRNICERYDIDIEKLADIINDPKVIPMLRGKSFEFYVAKRLKEILSKDYTITNPRLNAQSGAHDVDVKIIHTSGKTYSIECKLSKKGSFRIEGNNSTVQVKCMRSRTLGEDRANRMAPSMGLSPESLMIHNDQYRSDDFDLVITTIGNSFYQTDKEGLFFWSPPINSQEFFKRLNIITQQDAYSTLYFAFAPKISVINGNEVFCSRKKCQQKTNCGFIPNYPKIIFSGHNNAPAAPWYPINRIIEFV